MPARPAERRKHQLGRVDRGRIIMDPRDFKNLNDPQPDPKTAYDDFEKRGERFVSVKVFRDRRKSEKK